MMLKPFLAAIVLLLGSAPGALAAIDPAARCTDRKLGAIGRHARSVLHCEARGIQRGEPAPFHCLARADAIRGSASR